MSVRVRTSCPIPSRSHFGPIMPTTQRDAARRRDQKNESKRRRRAELKDSPDHRALINQSQRRRRAELTPSNQDLDKAQNTQSKRRRRAELLPEDKDQANAERRVKRRFDKDSPDQAKEQTDAARRRARQSIREYELIGLLQQRLRALSWPHWRLRCMQSLHGHGMGVVRP